MLTGKLFAALAIIFALCAWIITGMVPPSLDLSLHEIYLVIAPRQLLLFGLITCAIFSVLYFAIDRLLKVRWNRTLAILHISSVVLAAILFFVVVSLTHSLDSNASEGAIRGVFITGFLGVLTFVLGCLIFTVNLFWTVAVRARTLTPSSAP